MKSWFRHGVTAVALGSALMVCLSCGEKEGNKPQLGSGGNEPTPSPTSSMPESVVLEGRLDSEPLITTNRGGIGSGAVYIVSGQSSNIAVNPALSNQLNLEQAASREYVSPILGDCRLEIKPLGATPANRKVQFQFWTANEPDTAAPPYCYLFVNEIKSNGLTIKLTNVPTFGGMGTVKSVTIKLTK